MTLCKWRWYCVINVEELIIKCYRLSLFLLLQRRASIICVHTSIKLETSWLETAMAFLVSGKSAYHTSQEMCIFLMIPVLAATRSFIITLISMVSCQKGSTHHAYAWLIGPFWQDTLDLFISFRITSLALGQSYDCPSASEVILKNTGKWTTWIYIALWYNNNTTGSQQNHVHILWNVLYFIARICEWIIAPISHTGVGEGVIGFHHNVDLLIFQTPSHGYVSSTRARSRRSWRRHCVPHGIRLSSSRLWRSMEMQSWLLSNHQRLCWSCLTMTHLWVFW